jgi:hypothetical protein
MLNFYLPSLSTFSHTAILFLCSLNYPLLITVAVLYLLVNLYLSYFPLNHGLSSRCSRCCSNPQVGLGRVQPKCRVSLPVE